MSVRAVLLGATGLVGGQVLKQLLADPAYSEVRVLVRKTPAAGFPSAPGKLLAQIVDFAKLEALAFAGANHVYCCLGTTIRQAGSQEAFRRVDQEYIVAAAQLAAKAGAEKFLLISSVDANPRSRTFYLRVKGETEAAVGTSGIPEVQIFRPSFLLGHRAGSRPLEQLGIALLKPFAPLLLGPVRRYRPIEAADLARVMITHALKPRRDGVWKYEGAELG